MLVFLDCLLIGHDTCLARLAICFLLQFGLIGNSALCLFLDGIYIRIRCIGIVPINRDE